MPVIILGIGDTIVNNIDQKTPALMDFTFYKQQEQSKIYGISDGNKCYRENKARKEASGVIVEEPL